uniref:Putative protease inhibitor n=1 Tax=Superstitionia donensis TaxID=311983 RepID=A0A1V1WBJ9_9SCOR
MKAALVLLFAAVFLNFQVKGHHVVGHEEGCASPDEVFDPCGPSCPPSCIGVIKPGTLCSTECVPGCYCRDGLVRTARGTCVTPRACRNN